MKGSLFPQRTNVEFVEVDNLKQLPLRSGKGAGLTLACGTGARAAVVAGVITGTSSRDKETFRRILK